MNDGPITEQGDPRDRITNQQPPPPNRPVAGPSPFDPIENGPRDLGTDPLGPSPIDTIREALAWDFHAAPHDYHGNRLVPAESMDRFIGLVAEALAALTEVEHQLAAATEGGFPLTRERLIDRAVAAETALDAMTADRDQAVGWATTLRDERDKAETALAQREIGMREQMERAERAETALAEANTDAVQLGARLVAAEQRANALADALRAIADLDPDWTHRDPETVYGIARAALDRHTP